MTNTLIPGIYTSYELSGVRYTGKAGGAAGFVWKGSENETSVSAFTSLSQVVSVYGSDFAGFKLCELLFKNGAGVIKTVQTAGDYASAFQLLMNEADITVMVCDSTDASVHSAMKNAILSGGENTKYRIGIVGSTGTVSNLTAAAAALNCERMVMLPDADSAAALAGVILGTEDPSLPFNSAVLDGVDNDCGYTDDELNTLLAGGVTALDSSAGKCCVVRAVTTKTMTDGLADNTWRDLNTILITDYVIPQIRSALRAMFTRAKNTERTRGAVRTQVVIELERMVDRGIIQSYGNVSALKSTSDPSVCEVSFEFAVSGGMHQIIIAAGIIV